MWIREEAEEQHSYQMKKDHNQEEHYNAEDLLPSGDTQIAGELLVIRWRRIQTREVQLQKIRRTAGNKEYNGHQQMTLGGRSFEILEYILTGDVHKKLSSLSNMLMFAGQTIEETAPENPV